MSDSDQVPQLSDGGLYSRQMPAGRDSCEDAGFIVTASADGYDFYLYTCPYVVRGEGSGIWIVPDGRINGTIFFAIPHEERGKGLRDNGFYRSGWHLPQYLEPEDHEIVEEPGRVIWRLGGRSYSWDAQGWEIGGSHAGVVTDLRVRPVAAPMWRWGPWDQVIENDSAGYKVTCLVDGTVEAGGKTLRVRDGYATHERAVVGQSRDHVDEVADGAEVFAFEIRTDDVEMFIHRHTGRKMEMASVLFGDEAFQYGMGAEGTTVDIETLEHWHDPRSGLLIPSRWNITLTSAQGVVDLAIASSGRSYFHYNTGGGVMVMVQILGVANGTIRKPDGEQMTITDALVGLRWGRALLFAEESGSGGGST